MTEDEAKTKVCCGPRSGIQYFPNTSTLVGPNSTASLCIASGCMAWRWGQTAGEGPFKMDHGTGYCGLAGAPRP